MNLPFHVRPRWLRLCHKYGERYHRWFAWYPVKIYDGRPEVQDFRWVWLETVDRLITAISRHYQYPGYDYMGRRDI